MDLFQGSSPLSAFWRVFLFFGFFFFIFYLCVYFFSTVQHGDTVSLICIHSFLWHYMFHHKWLDRVPSAAQWNHIANPSRRQHFASIYPKLSVPPLLLDNHRSILQVHDFLFCGNIPLCRILDSRYKWYHMVYFFLFMTSPRMRVSSSIHVGANGIISFFFMAE